MDILLILIGHRIESATKVQGILTDNGDIIKIRLGLNRELSKDDNAAGFIFIELCGNEQRCKSLCEDLNILEDVKAEYLRMELTGCSCQS